MPSGVFKTYGERELKARHVRAGLRTVTICGCCAFVWMAIAIGMPLTMFMEAIGASGLQIGLVVAAQQLPLMLQIPSALLVERLPSRKPAWFVLAILHRAIWVVAAALPFTLGVSQATVWTLIAMVAVSFILGHMSAPIWQGWMADLVPKVVSARFWGARQAAMTFTFVMAVWLSGAVLDHFRAQGSLAGFGILFGVATLFGTLDICIHLRVPEPVPQPPPLRRGMASKFKEIAASKDFMRLTGGMAAWYFGVALIGAFTPVCMKRDFGMDYTQISIFIMAASFGAFLLSIPMGKLGGRFGSRTLCALCMIVGPSLLLAWFFVRPGYAEFNLPLIGHVKAPEALLVMLPLQMLSGGLYAGVGLYQFHLAGILSKREGRTLWMASHWFPIGVASALSPLLGGFLMDVFLRHPISLTLPMGCPMNFYHALLILSVGVSWIGAFLMLKISIKGNELSLEDIFRTLRTANPFRAVMFAYGMAFTGRDKRR